jgi:cell division protein FtsQ
MTKDVHALPETRSWREIPQQVKPRAMSGEGRRRVAMGTLRATMGVVAVGAALFGAWAVVASLRPGTVSSEGTTGERVKSLVLVTDGVLDRTWLARRLQIPQDATLMGLDLGVLRSRILADRQVVSASVERNFPSSLTVRVSERTPVVRMMAREGQGEPGMLLVSRDGIVFPGTGYDSAMLGTLPWLDGVTLQPQAGGFAPVEGMREVSDLLACARLEADALYRDWQVVSVARLASDGEIEVRTRGGLKAVFGAKEDYLRQIARLYVLAGASTDPTHPLRSVNLALGSQVPVEYGTAAPVLVGPPVNTADAPAESRALIAFPSFSSPHPEKHREL